jgi:hypothetical protein
MVRLLIGMMAGYILGTKAGRARYEQLAKAARAVSSNPATRLLISAGRQRLSDQLSTRPKLEPMNVVDERTTVLVPHDQLRR